MDAHERRIVRFLSRRAAYPHAAGRIERRETHVSHVFLAGEFAYKLKKPVKFPFLDASTLARRRRFCLLELSLNRRLTSGIYLGVVPVIEQQGSLRLGGRGRIIEWLVQMRRLPEARMLDQLVPRGAVSRADILRIADRLVAFFRRAARSRSISRYGAPQQVAALVLGNLAECRPFLGRLFSEGARAALESAYRQYLALAEPLLRRRVRQGRIIDGHGDLRCENICLPAGRRAPVQIFDCVEFEPAFRCGDMVNDLSFLSMDLEFRDRPDLARALVTRYLRRSRDPDAERLRLFYQCHRSLVRGKVRGFAWLQQPRTAHGRRVRKLAERHFALAVRYARQFAPPRLIVVGGLIGSGKSTLARALAGGLGAAWLRTDEIRLTEFANTRQPAQGFASGLYAPYVSERVYQRMIRRAEALLRQGRSVVCDGTFSRAAGRQALRRIARRHGASFHFFECVVPKTVALRRIARRLTARSDISEARPEHYDRLRLGFEPVNGWPARDWSRLSDNRPPGQTYQAALAALRRAWFMA